MKSPLRKLRGFSLNHHKQRGAGGGGCGERNESRDLRPLAQSDELAQASRDMHDMRDCYDNLLSAAAATANSAYEFSESLREMGACLLEKNALNDDEESGKVLLMLGKVQYEIQKLVDSYRSHLFQTITIPSQSLLNELRTVEEMKRQCDEKREVYEYMKRKQREKGRGRIGKGESFSLQQVQAAHEEYDEEATLFVFRLKSLKQGQSRSLLTQAARHHAAQLNFFKKSLKSLEAVEPHVKLVTEQQHIDYPFNGLDDDDGDGDGGGDDDDNDTYDDGELSFDYGQSDHEQDVSTSRTSMELDEAEVTFPQVAGLEVAKENLDGSSRKSFSFRREIRMSSQSAPLFAQNKSDPADKMKHMQPSSTRKYSTYVLPTPVDGMGSNTTGSPSQVPPVLRTSLSGRARHLWHSSPIEPKKYEKVLKDRKASGSTAINVQSILRESNNNTGLAALPPPLADRLLFSRPDPLVASESKKIKRQAFSGPISSKPWPAKPVSVGHRQLFSGPILRSTIAQVPLSSLKVSPEVSPSASPPFSSSPKISELHELPRPPVSSASKSSRPLVGHSAPLVPKVHMLPATSRSLAPNAASPLPTPSQVVSRSFSIPSSGLRAMALNASKPLEDIASPPLTPISLANA